MKANISALCGISFCENPRVSSVKHPLNSSTVKHDTIYYNTSKEAAVIYCVKNSIQVGCQGVQGL